MRGWNVLQEHFYAYSYLVGEMTFKLLALLQMHMTFMARTLLMPHYRTGALMGSITPVDQSGNGTTSPYCIQYDSGAMFAQVGAGGTVMSGPMAGGVGDPQSYLLEFGFRHVRSGRFIQYPYMIPALDIETPAFIGGMTDIAYLADGFMTPHSAGAATASLAATASKWRTFLYSTSRALGDVQVIVGSPFIGQIRSASLMAARGLGDLNAIMKASIFTRVEARLFGSFTTAMGRFNLSTSGTGFSNTANRIFNRYMGHGYGLSLRELTRMS